MMAPSATSSAARILSSRASSDGQSVWACASAARAVAIAESPPMSSSTWPG